VPILELAMARQRGNKTSRYAQRLTARSNNLLRILGLALRGEAVNEVETDLTLYLAAAERIADGGLEDMTNAELTARSLHLIEVVRNGGAPFSEPRDLEIATFSLVCEAARRALGLDPFEVQIIAGLAMARGRIAELPTGEGKTLAAVFPATFHALAGGGVHVLTFNDYLARRDAAWMGPIYRLLGLRVGCVQEGMSSADRRAAYRCDVTYLAAKEAGFDLLRDNLALEPRQQVHRRFNSAVLDEADSILVDEARIPLVIAGAETQCPDALGRMAELARTLEPGVDFETDDVARHIFLTERGVASVEAALGIDNLFAPDGMNALTAIRNALHAEHLLRADVDYIVRNAGIEIVDEFTGRVADKRHWPDGLQAAVEAKEGVSLGAGGAILGSITLQHFVKLYPFLCGMTATAASAADELWEVYGLPVAVIPPNRPCIRADHDDWIFADQHSRDRAVIEEIERAHSVGRPILVGTVSVAESGRLASELRRRGVSCQVLNARNDEDEAGVVAEAGDVGAVTISTNMAGRGTDIRLGGRLERHRAWAGDLGGLYVIGTHRHESIRVDRQLRGRAGRQGDPGASRFFVSLEDEILCRAGIERLIPRRLYPGGVERPLNSPVIRREVERAQRIAEGDRFEARKHLYEFAEVIERQRREIYAWRQELIEGRSAPGLLGENCRERWDSLVPVVGEDLLGEVERRLTVLAIDHCWAEHLAEMQGVRDEIHLVTLGGRAPIVEFTRRAITGFDQLLERIDETVVEGFGAVEITREGVDWEAHGLRGPSATWTYLVSDSVFAPNLLRTLANHATFGLWATLLWSPLLFIWGLFLHWRRRRDRRRGAAGATAS
jgi:preprotein translocase subunit SecA